jgi:predicted AAA+ superfamily ATPase
MLLLCILTVPEVSLMLHDGKTDAEKHESTVIWYENYISNIINRDIRALSDVDKITDLPRMLTLLANRVGNLLSHASFSRDVGLAVSTYKRYLTLFQHVYLVMLVEPWFRNVTKRLTKSPKVYLTDTALLMAILGRTSIDDYAMKGAVLENFVASELTKHINCLYGFKLFHFRTSDDKEVDFVVERADGKLIGIEVKYASTVTKSDFNGLKVLKEVAGDDFVRGVVLYQGDEILPFGDKLYAIPLSCLWGG